MIYTHSGKEGMSPNASGFRPSLLHHPLFSQRPTYVVTKTSLTKYTFRVIPSIQVPYSTEYVLEEHFRFCKSCCDIFGFDVMQGFTSFYI